MPPCADKLGRPIHDLRISVTDRCNFRCPYCMPAELYGENYQFLPKAELLSFEEELELSRRIQAGDHEARQELVTRNLRLVVRIARGMCRWPDASRPDLIQEGNVGLLWPR